MSIKSFEAFTAGRETVTKDQAWCDEWFPGESEQEVIEYGNGMFIIALGGGAYLLIIGNAQWESEDLPYLEKILYTQWYLPEIVGLGREKLEFALQIEHTRRSLLLTAATIHGDASVFEASPADTGLAELAHTIYQTYGGETVAPYTPAAGKDACEASIQRIEALLHLTAC